MSKINLYVNKSNPSLSDKVLGTDVDNSTETKNFELGDVLSLFNGNPVPATATDTGTKGQMASDGTHLYVCIATDTWMRVAISTF